MRNSTRAGPHRPGHRNIEVIYGPGAILKSFIRKGVHRAMQPKEATNGVHNGTAPADPAAVRGELERILASPQFRNSKRHSCFLRYVVEETLDGDSEQL